MDWQARVRCHLMTTFRANAATADRLLAVAMASLQEGLRRLTEARAAWERGTTAPLAAAAHFLKGTLANMGLAELAETARCLEHAARAGQDDALALAARLEAALGPWAQAEDTDGPRPETPKVG